MIGYSAEKKYFLEAIAAGNLAHAYILVGPDGVGKRTLANEVAAALFGVAPEKVPVNPNYIYVCRQEDEKTGKLKKEISVTQARELRARLAGSAWGSSWRVVVLDEVELLNAEASNALLKLLEEPPKDTVFFLLTTNNTVLLPTIQSRAQMVFLSPVTDTELRESMVDVSNGVVELAWGRPGRAQMLQDDSEKRTWYEGEVKRWQSLQGAPLHSKIALLEKVYGDKDDAQRGREKLDEMLELWTMLIRRQILAGQHDRAPLVDAITEARRLLTMNVHPKLIMENILIHI